MRTVVVASVHQQLMASSNNTKVVGMLRFNIDSEVDSTRVVGAQWVPGHAGQYFVVGHLSGRVYLYNKVRAKCPIHIKFYPCLMVQHLGMPSFEYDDPEQCGCSVAVLRQMLRAGSCQYANPEELPDVIHLTDSSLPKQRSAAGVRHDDW